MKHNKVPDRWEAYKSMGRQIPGTRFICFKVPLREEILENAVRQGAEWFCPRTLMDHCHNLGTVIDLTNTKRFYHPEVFTSSNIGYNKILTEGQKIPRASVVKHFFKIVNQFLDENKENEKLIGVHCTHGLNRTGYLVCRYMIEHLGIPPDQAISDFNSARGHEQERQQYLDHLRQLKWLQEPSLPDSDDEEEKTPTQQLQRRPKRNFEAMRGEDEDDETWSSGPVRKWPRTPHHQRNNRDNYYQGASYDDGFQSNNTPSGSGSRKRHQTKISPYQGQRYYDTHYRGRVAPQYDTNYYNQQGSGFGPHRQSPRNVQWVNNPSISYGKPRQYQGPRKYFTPKKESESLYSRQMYNTTSVTDSTPIAGSSRNPFSPGASDNVFSPATPKFRKHRKQ